MAALSTTLTRGRGPAFNKYVRDNPSWADLVLKVEEKLTATFFKESKKSTHGTLPARTEMKLLSNQESLIGKLRVAHVQVGGLCGARGRDAAALRPAARQGTKR